MEKLVWKKFILGTDNLDYILEKEVGGVIFFTKDILSKRQFKNLIKDIKSKSKAPLFLSIDQEGGRVERTENISPRRLSAQHAYKKGEVFLKKQSDEISKELADYGINLNFAPCVDVNTNKNNPIIGERAFSDSPEDVIKGMNIFIESSKKYGIISCIKHFPGHGNADQDSHITLPQIDLTLDEMEKTHIKPFKFAVENNIDMVMVAHLHCKCFDNEIIPTSLSKNAINYLRKTLNYNGIVISDDMVMQGLQNFGELEALIMAINAGVDMFIYRNSDNKVLRLIDRLCKIVENNEELKVKIMESNARIQSLKNKL